MDLRRLRAGEWLAAAAGVVLIFSLTQPWYQPLLLTVPYDSVTGFEVFSIIDILLVLAAAVGVALAILQATRTSPALPVAFAVLSVVTGILATLLVVFRLIDVPRNDELESMDGASIALLATIALTAGGWLSLRNERVRHLPPGPEPELRPTPQT